MNERMTIRSVSAAVGAEILDLDLAGSLPESTIDEIRRALGQHGVVFFRDQKLTPEQHVAFAQRRARSTSIVSSRRWMAIL
jgi:taurine dioxygenase